MNGSSQAGSAAPEIVGWMSVLADPTRARILLVIERHELTVADICKVLQAPQSTVSRHLKVLGDDGWVSARPEGTSRLYRMAREDLDPAARRLWSLVREQSAATNTARHDEGRLTSVIAERRTRSQQFFSSSADQWNHMRRDLFGQRFDLEALAALLDPAWVVGDLGCGTGQVAASLAPFVRSVIAVESSSEMLRAAAASLAAHPNVELRTGELEALPIDDGALDAVTISLVLHHVADPLHVVHEAARVLKPGGRLMIIDMSQHDRSEYKEQMGHVWLGFQPERVRGWLGDAGFEKVRTHPLAPDPNAKGPALFVAAGERSSNERRPPKDTENGTGRTARRRA